MKNLFKVRHIVSIIMVTALATCVFAGCTKESPSVDFSKATSSSQSSAEEKSQGSPSSSVVESSAESADNSAAEASVESKEEKSVAVSEEESSEVVSVVESSGEVSSESSVESSDISSAESSLDSETESSVEEESESSALKLEDAIRFGTIISNTTIHDLSNSIVTQIVEGNKIAILSINDDNTYNFIMFGMVFVINQDAVELLPEDYVPDPSETQWKAAINPPY